MFTVTEVPIINPTGRGDIHRGKFLPAQTEHLPDGAVGKAVVISASASHYEEVAAWEALCVACRADPDFPAMVLGFTDERGEDVRTITVFAV